jgi:hypothetical protein
MRTLREIVDDYARLDAETQEWYAANVEERLAACQSREEVLQISAELGKQAADDSGQMREIPWGIQFPCIDALSKFLRGDQHGKSMEDNAF